MTTSSPLIPPHLQAFIDAYADWLDAGAPHLKPFVQDTGLCGNTWNFAEDGFDRENLRAALETCFQALSLSSVTYPFNRLPDGLSDISGYDRECLSRTCHFNPARRAFILTHRSKKGPTT